MQPDSRPVAPCPRCQTANPVGNRFCESCGAALGAASEPVSASPVSAAPSGVSVELARALRARDHVLKHAASEEELRSADAEVNRLKSLISDKRGEITVELDGLRRDLSAQEVRYKAGEYTEAQYRNATADVRRRIASLERLQESFDVLLAAETEAAARHTAARPVASLSTKSPAAAKGAAREEISGVQEYRSGTKGFLDRIPAPKWMLLGSGVLIAISVVAAGILVLQTVAGSANLPSLSSPFQKDGGTISAPPTSAVTTPPATAATPAPVVAGAEFQVPIQLRGAQGVGSLYIELEYDPAAIDIVRLDAAALPAGTLFEYRLGQGSVSIGAVSSGGLTGDWALAFITCRRVAGAATSGETTVLISDVQAHRAADLSPVGAGSTNGHVNLSSLAVVAPTITFG